MKVQPFLPNIGTISATATALNGWAPIEVDTTAAKLRERNDVPYQIVKAYGSTLTRDCCCTQYSRKVVAMAVIKMSLDDVQKLLARMEFVSECIRLDYSADALCENERIKQSLLQAVACFACFSPLRPELLN